MLLSVWDLKQKNNLYYNIIYIIIIITETASHMQTALTRTEFHMKNSLLKCLSERCITQEIQKISIIMILTHLRTAVTLKKHEIFHSRYVLHTRVVQERKWIPGGYDKDGKLRMNLTMKNSVQ